MARFDVHPMPGGRPGYVLDVQADLLSELATRVVVPRLPAEMAPKPFSDLNPVFEVDGTRLVMMTQAIASIPRRELSQHICSLAAERDSITRALDVLLIGF
jgi:toxin CcdB